MTSSPRFRSGALALLLSTLIGGVAIAAPISGAIFTSDVAGNVNVNQYENKADVYLNGGPKNDNCAAAGVDDGTYVFQITNPNGDVILSSDDISHREFTVVGGVITSATDHAVVAGDCGGVRVQMAPPPPPETANLNVYKFYDANANGDWDPDEVPLFGWMMTASNGNGYAAQQLTQSPDGITTFSGLTILDNPYAVQEGTAGGTWHQSALIIDGAVQPVANPASGLNLVANETTEVIFGNYCDCKSGGKQKSWWVTASGQTKVNDGSTMNPEFNALNMLNLRSSSGSPWNLNTALAQSSNWTTLVNWLNGTSTTNMAYALSRSLAILRLNIDAGYTSGTNFYAPAGLTVSALMAEANAALGADGNTPVGDEPNRATQAQLRAWIDAINTGTATVIKPKPCAYSFSLPPPT